MNTQHSTIDNRSQRQVIKSLVEIFPAIGVAILFVDLIQKSIHHGDVSTLMVSSEQINSIRVFDFETKKERNGLD